MKLLAPRTGGLILYSSPLVCSAWSSVLSRFFNHKDDPHKSFWPPDWGDIVGYTFAAVSLFIAAGGGIGGGGILVPLYILVMGALFISCISTQSRSKARPYVALKACQRRAAWVHWPVYRNVKEEVSSHRVLHTGFPTNTAVALSNITIVGGAISNFLFNVGRRHAFFDRPLIDWNIILAMEPATILGALLGGYLNKVRPATFCLFSLPLQTMLMYPWNAACGEGCLHYHVMFCRL